MKAMPDRADLPPAAGTENGKGWEACRRREPTGVSIFMNAARATLVHLGLGGGRSLHDHCTIDVQVPVGDRTEERIDG